MAASFTWFLFFIIWKMSRRSNRKSRDSKAHANKLAGLNAHTEPIGRTFSTIM